MVSVGEDSSFSPEDAIDPASERDEVSLQAAKQGGAVLGLDDQVQVVGLNRVVNDADASALDAPAEGVLDCVGEASPAKGRQSFQDPCRDVDRIPSLMERAGFVPFARTERIARRPASAGASATPPGQGELKLMRPPTRHRFRRDCS